MALIDAWLHSTSSIDFRLISPILGLAIILVILAIFYPRIPKIRLSGGKGKLSFFILGFALASLLTGGYLLIQWTEASDDLDRYIHPTRVQNMSLLFFEYNYNGTNPIVAVEEGDLVIMNFRNLGVQDHDFAIDELDVFLHPFPGPGEAAIITFIATKQGQFEYYCTLPEHRENGMFGTIIVTGKQTG